MAEELPEDFEVGEVVKPDNGSGSGAANSSYTCVACDTDPWTLVSGNLKVHPQSEFP